MSGPPYPVLPFTTADNTAITCDSINYTADGASLANGGGTTLPGTNKAKNPNFTDAAYLRF
jgi:hypothetical protein